MLVGGMAEAASAGRVGSGGVRMMVIGRCGQVSSAASGTTQGSAFGPVPWLNQSRIMNCSHAATSEFTVVAGTNSVRVSSARLISRGLGVSTPASSGRTAADSGTFRPNRVPAMPIRGFARSLYEPSVVRLMRCRSVGGSIGGGFTAGRLVVSCRFFSRSRVRRPSRVVSPSAVGSRSQPIRWSTYSATAAYNSESWRRVSSTRDTCCFGRGSRSVIGELLGHGYGCRRRSAGGPRRRGSRRPPSR